MKAIDILEQIIEDMEGVYNRAGDAHCPRYCGLIDYCDFDCNECWLEAIKELEDYES